MTSVWLFDRFERRSTSVPTRCRPKGPPKTEIYFICHKHQQLFVADTKRYLLCLVNLNKYSYNTWKSILSVPLWPKRTSFYLCNTAVVCTSIIRTPNAECAGCIYVYIYPGAASAVSGCYYAYLVCTQCIVSHLWNEYFCENPTVKRQQPRPLQPLHWLLPSGVLSLCNALQMTYVAVETINILYE